MGEFQTYIMDKDKDLYTKMDIIRRLKNILQDKKDEFLFFDKSVVFKTEIARMFIDYMNIDVDRAYVLTACLLCNCKKVDNAQILGKVKSFAKEGADYLMNIGFEPRFCKMCEGVNRYSGLKNREPESDLLEVVDHFGGMLLDRPERAGFTPEEAIVQMERDNFKNIDNKYLSQFHSFVDKMQNIMIQPSFNGETISVEKTPFAVLKKNVFDDSKNLEDMIRRTKQFGKQIDSKMLKQEQELDDQNLLITDKGLVKDIQYKDIENKNAIEINSSRSLFTKETVDRIIKINSSRDNLERGA